MLEAIEVFPTRDNNDAIRPKETIIDIRNNDNIENDIKKIVGLLATCLDEDLKNYESLYSLKKITPNLLATLFGLGIGIGSLFLYDQESGDFAKIYLKTSRFETIFITTSCDYANLILGSYTSYKLINLLFDLDINKQIKGIMADRAERYGNKIGSRAKSIMLFIVGSAFTAIPLSLPIHNNYKKIISFACNTAINLYSFLEARSLYKNNVKVSHYDSHYASVLSNIKNYQFKVISNIYNKEHISGIELSELIKVNLMTYAGDNNLKYLRYLNMLIIVMAVVPYFLTLYVILNNFFADFNLNNYLNLFLAMAFSAVCNIPIGLLGLIFAYFIIDLIKDFINIKYANSIAKAIYPKTYISLGLLQMLATFFSWSTGAKLFLDYFGGSDFTHLSKLQLAIVYAMTAVITLGIYEFILFPNLQMINTSINFMFNIF